MSQWVQHISGTGEKWEVYRGETDKFNDLFVCEKDMTCYALPKSEYRLCDPPEVWEACTKEVVVIGPTRRDLRTRLNKVFKFIENHELCEGYRWACQGDALIIERKKS